MSRITLDTITKKPNEVLRINIDFTLYGLDTSELLTGVPIVLEIGTSDLTLANKQVNPTTFINNRGKTAEIGKGIQFTIAGGIDGSTYEVEVQCGTNGTIPQILEVTQPFEVKTTD